MSSYAMMGLLEGLGKGITGTGEAMQKLNLQQAEERRQLNLARIQREWANQDENTRYQRNLSDQERIRAEDREYQEGQDVIKRAQTVADQDKALQASVDKDAREHTNRLAEIDHQADATARNRQPTEFERKLTLLDKMKAEGKITDEEYKNNILGLQKTANFSAKDLADFKLKSLEQATLEIRGKDPLQPATPEEQKAIEKRAGEIFRTAVGSASGGGGLLENSGSPAIDLYPKLKADIAAKLATATPEQIPGAIKTLEAKGLTPGQIAEVQKEAEALKTKKEGAKAKAEDEKKKGLEAAERGEGLLSEGAYRFVHGMPAEKPSVEPVDPNRLTHRQRLDRQSFSKQAPWLQQ